MNRILDILELKLHDEVKGVAQNIDNDYNLMEELATKAAKTSFACEQLRRAKDEHLDLEDTDFDVDAEIQYITDKVEFFTELLEINVKYKKPTSSKYGSQLQNHLWYLRILQSIKYCRKEHKTISIMAYNGKMDGFLRIEVDKLDDILNDFDTFNALDDMTYMIVRINGCRANEMVVHKKCELISKLEQLGL